MLRKLLVVVGATGSQGQAVINHFLAHEPTYRLRGLTRSPTSSNATALANRGVEIMQADLDDKASLQRAFRGANAIFAYTATDIIASTLEATSSFESGRVQSLGEAAYPIEVRQGKNIADAAAAVGESLERVVWSSLSKIRELSGGKYRHAWHEDAKAEIGEYMMGLEGLRGKVNMVVMGAFADNAVKAPDLFAPKKVNCFIVPSIYNN